MDSRKGSSPRVRGAGVLGPPAARADGIIPACAGSSSLDGGEVGAVGIIPACAGSSIGSMTCQAHRRDHPRVCGEQETYVCAMGDLGGSSPRVRGAVTHFAPPCSLDGIIPACAGSRSPPTCARRWTGDHPRVCGEQPASSRARRGPWDHPRVCGEQIDASAFGTSVRGSSPRVRGAGPLSPAVCPGGGIIPACAGSSSSLTTSRTSRGDHPRVCGEQPSSASRANSAPGSSPRVRGAVWPSCHARPHHGIIPACAGSSLIHIPEGEEWRDHPRVCGEQRFICSESGSRQGSSPRVRGAGRRSQAGRTRRRIIPACAGSRLEIRS